MEKTALISYGARAIAHERLCLSSDAFRATYCRKCGILAVSDMLVTKQISCRNCRSTDPKNFGICTISYVTKYLINLLNGTGIDVRFGFSEIEKLEKDVYTLEEAQKADDEFDEEQAALDAIIEEKESGVEGKSTSVNKGKSKAGSVTSKSTSRVSVPPVSRSKSVQSVKSARVGSELRK
jgi:hypothetical protein